MQRLTRNGVFEFLRPRPRRRRRGDRFLTEVKHSRFELGVMLALLLAFLLPMIARGGLPFPVSPERTLSAYALRLESCVLSLVRKQPEAVAEPAVDFSPSAPVPWRVSASPETSPPPGLAPPSGGRALALQIADPHQ